MNAEPTPELTQKRRAGLARIERLAWWLDDAFEIPVIGKRIGVDGLIGLVPVAGDLIGAGLSSLLVVEAVRLGAPKSVWLRMGANIGIDFATGAVPVVGDVFDIVWKANRRNERVMRRWLQAATTTERPSGRKRPGTPTMVLALAAAGLLIAVSLRALNG